MGNSVVHFDDSVLMRSGIRQLPQREQHLVCQESASGRRKNWRPVSGVVVGKEGFKDAIGYTRFTWKMNVCMREVTA